MTDEIVSTGTEPGERPSNGERDSSKAIRIAFCITDLDVGGAERMFVELVTRLDRRLWEPRVFCLSRPGKLVERLNAANIPVVCFGAQSVWQFGVVWMLARELKRLHPELLQCFLYHANLIGRLAARWAGVPRVVCGIRVAERRSRFRLWLDRLTQRFVDHNVCVSRAVADFSIGEGGLRANKVSVIPNAVDFGLFASAEPVDRTTLGFAAAERLALFVGRLDPQKAPFVLLEAFERLLLRHPNWQLLFVGDGPLWGAMGKWIADHNLSHNIRLAGWQPNVPQLLKSSDCLVLPSLWEGMPNIVLEAMASGLPVVVSRVEGTEELVVPEQTGLLVSPNSVDDLEHAVEEILSRSDLSTRLARNAQQHVQEHFTFEAMITAYEHLYRRLLS